MKRILTIATLLICLTGCEFIPLYDLEGNVMLNIEYDLEQQVNVRQGFDPSGVTAFNEKVHGQMPEYVQVQFYDVDTHDLIIDEYLDAEGGMMNVPTGFYDILIYSLNTKVTEVTGNTLSGKYAYTDLSTRAYDIGSYRNIIAEPDHLYVAALENVEVLPVNDDVHTMTYINATASSILETWTIEIRDVEGLGYIAGCELFITTQEGRSFLWGDRQGNQPGALKISVYPDFNENRLYSVFNTFGRYDNYIERVYAVLKVTNTAGNEYLFSFNVSDQFDDIENVGHNLVVDQHIVIPDDGGASRGFEPVVNPWWEDPIIITE